MRAFSVLSPLPELVVELNAFQPALLSGYATALALLAREQEAGRLRIAPVLTLTLAEWIPPDERQRMAEAFGGHVRDAYASSEALFMAGEGRCGWLHVNAARIILEPVDEDGQPTPPGQPSHSTLVTNLANHVQPVLRYHLTDRVTTRPDPCSCGSPLPAIRVEGRTDEILAIRLPGGDTVHVLPLAIGAVVEETPGVESFQLIQTGPAELTVRLAAAAEVDRVWGAVQERLRAYLAAQGTPGVGLRRAAEGPARNPRGGKFRQVWSEFRG